jgi:hypothetical protein
VPGNAFAGSAAPDEDAVRTAVGGKIMFMLPCLFCMDNH